MPTQTNTLVFRALYIWLWCSAPVAGKHDVPEMLQIVPSSVTVTQSNIPFDERMKVTTNNYETLVYIYNNDRNGKKYTANELHAFYTAVSCTFGVWTASKMYNFVESST